MDGWHIKRRTLTPETGAHILIPRMWLGLGNMVIQQNSSRQSTEYRHRLHDASQSVKLDAMFVQHLNTSPCQKVLLFF